MPCTLVQQFSISEECITSIYRAKELAKQQEEARTYSSTLKLEAVCPSETQVNFYWTTWHNITEDSNLYSHCSKTSN
jgi:hypothetical protein